MTTMMIARTMVDGLLEDTIVRSTKSQTDADGELVWLRNRLEAKRRDPCCAYGKGALESDDNSAPNHQSMLRQTAVTSSVAPADKENLPSHGANRVAKAQSMNVLQLRRLLRAIGQPTVGLKPTLVGCLESSVSSGVVRSYVSRVRSQPRDAVECAGERRKVDAIVAMAEALLESNDCTVESAPKQPLAESKPRVAENTSSRSSVGSDKGKMAGARKLSGPEQDAVVAKIRSAAEQVASPAKKLPFQDDDTPITKSARLKKEMEERLARQNQLKTTKAKVLQTGPSGNLLGTPPSTPVTPPSLRPVAPSSPAPMSPTTLAPVPSTESKPEVAKLVVAPPPPKVDAPKVLTPKSSATPSVVSATPSIPTTAPTSPATTASAPSTTPTAPSTTSSASSTTPSEPSTTPSALSTTPSIPSTKLPALSTKVSAPSTPPPVPKTSGLRPETARDHDGDGDASSKPPVPESEVLPAEEEPKRSQEAKDFKAGTVSLIPAPPLSKAPVPSVVEEMKKTAASVDSKASEATSSSTGMSKKEGQQQVPGRAEEASAPQTKVFGSPGRFKTPATRATPRKANQYANQSISSPATGSPLKAAAHKALNRVAKPEPEVAAPSTSSTTQDAFAKFRAMDAAGKKGQAPGMGYKKTSPSPYSSPVKTTPSQMFSSHHSDTSSTSGMASNTSPTPSKFEIMKARREKQEAEAAVAATKAKADAAAAANRVKLVRQVERERAEALLKAKQKAAEEKAKAEEARREAQAKADTKAKEEAAKAAREREDRLKTEAAAEAAAVRREEEKRKAAAAARKEEQEAAAAAAAVAALKRSQQTKPTPKPPTPPRPSTKAPPTPPRPGHHGQSQAQAPPTPPRPPSHSSSTAPTWSSPSKTPKSATPLPALGASSQSSIMKKEPSAHKLALEKKKQEIAKRMEDMRNKKMPKVHATPAPAPAPTPVSAPAPAAKPVAAIAPTPTVAATGGGGKGAVAKEDRESYDDYDVEPESGEETGEEGEEPAQEIVEPQETAADKSAIPDWARGKALAKILDKQFGGPNPVNPDKIFPEFFTCNLEHIFNTKKSKWDRSSSGNWHTDRLTIAEKLAYQRAMGFDK